MKSLRFILSGPAACFRQPDVNAQVYFTYNNIHRVALLGLLGAILGLKGYRNAKLYHQEERAYPEFYELLSPLGISVSPNSPNGYFTKKIQYFNNSAGYASKEAGGNLQVREQWLESPSWTVFLAQRTLPDDLWNRLCQSVLKGQCVYLPYLGRNDFPAQIDGADMVELSPSRQPYIHSLFRYDGDLKALAGGGYSRYLLVETAPVALAADHHFYRFGRYVFMNGAVPEQALPDGLYSDGKRQYAFY
jgi:CRISPR-associated protein Cas5h